MPRQGVPYPGKEICSLKERIAELEDKIEQLMKSINGVSGDGQGNVTLAAGHPAIVINNDAAHNEVEIDLDTSELPAADVTSVNGKTGAVVLGASDVPSDGSSDVQSDIDSLKVTDTGLASQIGAEQTARIAADAQLQNNINNATAQIPGAVASAIAADATIAQLAAADAQNVKLTGNQSITGQKTVPQETTGQYSAQVANSNKVKAELDAYAPMVRTTGNQTIGGTKEFTSSSYGQIRLKTTADNNNPENLTQNVWGGIIGCSENETTWEIYYNHDNITKRKSLNLNLSKIDGSYNGLSLMQYDPEAPNGERTYGFGVNSSICKGPIRIESTNIDRDIIPSSGVVTPQIFFTDKNGNLLGFLDIYIHQNGHNYFQLGMYDRTTQNISITDLKMV